jgi:uncharacterized membrane protein YhdT
MCPVWINATRGCELSVVIIEPETVTPFANAWLYFTGSARTAVSYVRPPELILTEETKHMLIALTLPLMLLEQPVPRFASLSVVVFLILFVGSLLGWLVAAVLGFARARAFGPATRWFAMACICLLGFNLHLMAVALFGMNETDPEKVLNFGAFAPLFILLGSICAIIGFVRLTNPRP